MPSGSPPRARGSAQRRPVGCPCGSGEPYADCCGRLHDGAVAVSAEQLMRSRYSAFAVGDADYLVRTWDPQTRPSALEVDRELTWCGLDIVATSGGGVFDATGMVEFRAFFRQRGRIDHLHERSLFRREEGGWRYVGPEGR